MTLTLPRRAVVDPDELPATVSAPPASPTSAGGRSGQPSEPEWEWLRKLNWGLFETLVESAFSRDGFAVEPVPQSLDGRADMLLLRRGERLLVQCKYWKAWQIGTSAVAELRELVDDAGLDNGLLITAGTFSSEAAELAEESGLLLLDGDDLLRMAAGGPVLPLADETSSQWALPKGWTAFGAPTCPLCEAPMLYKRVRAGEHTGMRFWGCRHYPTCRAIREVGPAYAGLPLERPVPHEDSAGAVAQAVELAEEVAPGEEVAPAEEVVGSPDAMDAPQIGPEPEAEDVVVEPTAAVHLLPSAPVPSAAMPSLPALPLASMPLPTPPVVESPAQDAAPEDAAPVAAAATAALPVAPPPSVVPIVSELPDLVPVVSESTAEASAAILPSAPAPQLSSAPAPHLAESGPEVVPVAAAAASDEPAIAPVAAPPAQAVAEAAGSSVPAVLPAPALPAPALPAPALPAMAVPAPAFADEAPLPPLPPQAAPTEVISAPLLPQAQVATAEPVVEPVAREASPFRFDSAAPASPGWPEPVSAMPETVEPELVEPELPEPELAEPELVEPEPVEPEVILRRRAELGLPELQLPPGTEDSYTVLLAHPTWSDPRDEDDVPSFVPEEHTPYQWPTSADLVDEDRAPISWPESAPEPLAEVLPEVAAAPSRRRQYLVIGAALAVAAVLTIAVAVLIPAVMSAMKLIMH